MSQENVDIARRACEAAWRRPSPDIDTINALAHPDHELVTPESLVEGGSYRGAKGYRDWLTNFSEIYGESWECKVEQARGIDDEQVLVTCFAKAQGARGGVEVGQRFWIVIRVVEGKIARSVFYTDPAQALGAVGLSE
jgi:ketosteroid isomerase-like protein